MSIRRPRPSRFRPRFAADDKQDEKKSKKKGTKEQRQPGQTSPALRRRMGDALADIFDQFGPEIYADAILALKDGILEQFKAGFEAIDQTIKDELGRRGVDESREHIRGWADGIVEDINHAGLDEVGAALEDFVGTLTSEYVQEEEGEELLEVDELDIEPVEEVEEEEVAPEEEGEEELALEETDLEDLGLELPGGPPGELPGEPEAKASFDPRRSRRPRPRRFRREARRRCRDC
jgi:hypothetical protein